MQLMTHILLVYSCGLELQLELVLSFFPLSFYIHTCVFAFDKVELFFCIVEQYSEKNFLLSFTQYTRELGEESVVSNDNAQCASVRIYTCTRRLLLFASLVMGICIHIRSLIHHAIFFFSFFLFLPFFFSHACSMYNSSTDE